MKKIITIILILMALLIGITAADDSPKELQLRKELAQTKLLLLQERTSRLQAEHWIANEQVKVVQEDLKQIEEGERKIAEEQEKSKGEIKEQNDISDQ